MSREDEWAIRASGLFDPAWYALMYGDLFAQEEDRLQHFLKHGAELGCRPNPLFDVSFYVEQSGGVPRLRNPLAHYILIGSANGIGPHPLFDEVWYQRFLTACRLRAPQTSLGHFLHVGRKIGLTPNAFFNDAYYLATYPDVAEVRCDPLYHFEQWGEAEGRQPSEDATAATLDALTRGRVPGDRPKSAIAGLIRSHPGEALRTLVDTLGSKAERSLDQVEHFLDGTIPNVLLISHRWGGGVARFVEERVQTLIDRFNIVVLTTTQTDYILRFRGLTSDREMTIASLQTQDLVSLLQRCRFTSIELHHVHGFRSIKDIIGALDSPIILYLHDYFLLSPQPHLLGPDGTFVGDELELHHAALQRAAADTGHGTVRSWQRAHRWLFEAASRVIAPSVDVSRRVEKIYPWVAIDVVPYEMFDAGHAAWPSPDTPSDRRVRGPAKVALIGYMQQHKGIDIARAVFDLARKKGLELSFVIIGYCDDGGDLGENVRVTGRYADAELSDLLRREDPDLVWFPAQCPETWSFTLSAALRHGLPVLCSNIGAFEERVRGLNAGAVFPWDATPAEWLACITDVLAKRGCFHFADGALSGQDESENLAFP